MVHNRFSDAGTPPAPVAGGSVDGWSAAAEGAAAGAGPVGPAKLDRRAESPREREEPGRGRPGEFRPEEEAEEYMAAAAATTEQKRRTGEWGGKEQEPGNQGRNNPKSAAAVRP